ncbi:MAG: ribosome maturation factor RimP [Magnetococcales bacterium]|nr:ribosome maturation factor RimP [Magnetococcales bacterium]
MSSVVEQVSPLATAVAAEAGCELVDVAYLKEGREWILRLAIDHPAGVGLDLCATVSSGLAAVLDRQEVMPGPYRLEVSSPGLTRPLRKREEFEQFRGRLAVVKTFRPLVDDPARRKSFRGVLQGVDGDDILLNTGGETQPESVMRIPFDLISKAHLDVDF